MSERPQVILPPAPDCALRIKHVYKAGWEQWYWFQGDVHHDAPDCLRRLYKRHLDEAKALGALIIDGGDLPDVVCGVGDKRASKSGLRHENKQDNYIDSVVDHIVYDHKPYADMFVQLGEGNHDSKVRKMYGSDIVRRVADGLNAVRNQKLPPIHKAGYESWVRFEFATPGNSNKQSYDCKIFHGTGGGGKVTKGIIQTNRRNADSDADIFVTHHIHEQWYMPTIKTGLTQSGRVRLRKIIHAQCGAYKLDFSPAGDATWHTEREGGAKPLGGCFLRFFSTNGNKVHVEVRYPEIDYDGVTDELTRQERKLRVA